MRKVRVCIELDDEKFRAFEREAERQHVTVEDLVTRSVHLLFHDLEEREKDDLEPPIFIT